MRKIINIIVAFMLALCLAVFAAAEQTNVISLGGISVMMPEITVEIKGSDYDKNEISATLDSEKLTVVDVAKYDIEKNSSCAYILVDLSVSMKDSFSLIKKNIVSYIEDLNKNDKVILITFGEEVETVLDGSEEREEAIEAVEDLRCNDYGTSLYEALDLAYQMAHSSNSTFDREYVIAFTDAVDERTGKITFDEVLKLYESRSLPLYAAYYETEESTQTATNRYGELARSSGGSIVTVYSRGDFGDLIEELNDVTIVELKASTNRADGQEKQLSVKVGSSQVEYNIPIQRSIADTTAPTVKSVIFDSKKDAFVVTFSEKVVGATEKTAYRITNSTGKTLEISDVFYSENDNAYEIKTKDAVYMGKYTFEFSGIKDDSQEGNALVEKKTVNVAKSGNFNAMPIGIIVAVTVVVLLAGGVVIAIFAMSSKKKTSEKDVPVANIPVKNNVEQPTVPAQSVPAASDVAKYHIKGEEPYRIRLQIKTGRISEQNIETNIVSSLIVGRSDACDIYIDDTKLSRQHFVIENDSGTFYVMDLQSRNGTMVNGIRINTRHQLSSGDKIMAGLSDIIITILGR